MQLTRRAFVGGSLACCAIKSSATSVPLPDRLAPRAMAADLELIRHAYSALHPGLTRYLTQQGFDELISAATRWAARARSPGEFYLVLARLTAAVRCGHTHANPANQRRAVQEQLLGRPDRLPFCAAWIEGRMVVTDGLASGLPAGTLIEAVNGIGTDRMLRAMLPLARADGHNDAKRIAQLELHRGDRFAAFDLLRPLLFGGEPRGEAHLTLRYSSGERRGVVLPTIGEAMRGTRAADDPQYGWRFQIDADGIGLLTMPDWSLYNTKWDWRHFIHSCVDALIEAKARGLVVDLRENEGGLDCGDALLTRLVVSPVVDAGTRRLVRFRQTPRDLRPALDTWDPSFHTLGVSAVPAADKLGYFELGESEGRRIDPEGRRFDGKVAVLVSATCSSATFGFAQLVRQCGAATLIGTPTGGNRRGINGGRYFFLRLPETGFEVDLPLIGYFPARPQPDAGLVPYIVVRPTISALRSGVDETLARARRHLLDRS